MSKIKKSQILYNSLSSKQKEKLEKDFTTYSKNTVLPQLDKINSMLASGYYTGETLNWLRSLKARYLAKNSLTSFILANSFIYSNL